MSVITLIDGGMSRELQRCGATLAQPEWSALALIHQPEIVRKAHEEFIKAGAEVIIANNYAVVPFHLGEDRFAAQGGALAHLAGQLAREATQINPSVKVAGALPPACGSYVPDQFDADKARAILSVLIENMDANVDLWIAETMSSLEEARVTAQAAKASDKPLWMAFSLRDDLAPEQMPTPQLRSNEAVEDAVKLAIDMGAKAVLFNCSMPEVMKQAIEVAAQVLRDLGREIPIGVYANAFAPVDEPLAANEALNVVRADLDPAGYCIWVDQWIAAGATIVGGCCGIDAPHIAALHAHLKAD
ncbi:homocysteine S-methyltransferase [Pacificibacter maritimus]|uniref:Homocysteine S-methyltransferase n=1 Tax=Pacificibacter maritimus TaxID=762213 RepID=A0A3N4ULQ2_9RHOB|nr:homocysteine S-methyltransferase family protein [Pacificibacter maritimus]RPE62950.1 homocysteine S-methyltransferase [Pacificibacter maritimus]